VQILDTPGKAPIKSNLSITNDMSAVCHTDEMVRGMRRNAECEDELGSKEVGGGVTAELDVLVLKTKVRRVPYSLSGTIVTVVIVI
jgi:hypothetical protein